jgi:hypothetical protein
MQDNNQTKDELRKKGLEVIESWLKILENKNNIESQNSTKIDASTSNS